MADKHETMFVAAFDAAIRKVGLEKFKATSLFGTSELPVELKKAA